MRGTGYRDPASKLYHYHPFGRVEVLVTVVESFSEMGEGISAGKVWVTTV